MSWNATAFSCPTCILITSLLSKFRPEILCRLVDEGHTLVVIEHHPDVYAEAGNEGGKLVAAETPDEMKKNKVSRTARFL